MTNLSKGLLAAVASNLLFSILFLYGMWMKPMTETEMFAWHMVIMLSVLCMLTIMVNGWQAAMRFVYGVGRDWERWLLIVLPTPTFANRLWLFVRGPANGEGVNIVIGYFLSPLTMTLGGRIWFKERLNRLQRVAVILAYAGVTCELVRSGAFSWTIVWMLGTYPFYYPLRHKLGVPSLIGLTFDLMMTTLFALAYIVLATDTPAVITVRLTLIFFIVLPGSDSVVSMHLSLKTNQLLPVAAFGTLNYLEPVLLFTMSTVWLGEPVQDGALIDYGLIWLGLCVMIVNGLLGVEREKKLAKFD